MKHKLAYIYMANELARSRFSGVWVMDGPEDKLIAATATTRVDASDTYWLVSNEVVHLHGGADFN